MTTTLSLKLTKSLAARLQVAARSRNTTPAKVARECLERELASSEEQEPWIIHSAEKLSPPPPGESAYKKMLPVLEKAWAKGRNLPRDLSINPKHMDGFGQ